MIKIKRNDYERPIIFTENVIISQPITYPPVINIPDFIKNLDKK
jgi:hypothetical protein